MNVARSIRKNAVLSRSAVRTFAAVAAALSLLALALGACSKRITEVDPTFTFPEGRVTDESQLVIWYEVPVVARAYADDTEPPGPERDPFCPAGGLVDPGDPLIDTVPVEFNPAGSASMVILDHTASNTFRPLRRESNGGYGTPLDYSLTPTRKWLEPHWELYTFNDSQLSGFTPPTYIARGAVGGVEGANSPLTNEAELRLPAVGDINYTGPCLPCDSLFALRWDPVPGTVRYWIHVYQLAPGVTENQQVEAARTAPLNTVRPRDFLLAFADSTVTSYQLGQAPPAGVTKLVEASPVFGQSYMVRIAAVDALGQLIAVTRGDLGVLEVEGGYVLYPLNATLVNPKRPGIGPPFCNNNP
jgi:hypothetical protein